MLLLLSCKYKINGWVSTEAGYLHISNDSKEFGHKTFKICFQKYCEKIDHFRKFIIFLIKGILRSIQSKDYIKFSLTAIEKGIKLCQESAFLVICIMLSLKECLWNKRSVAHLSKWCWCSIWTTFRLNILRTFLIDFKLFAKRAKRARIYTGKIDTFDHFLWQFFTCQETDGIRRDQAGFVEKSLKFWHTVWCFEFSHLESNPESYRVWVRTAVEAGWG